MDFHPYLRINKVVYIICICQLLAWASNPVSSPVFLWCCLSLRSHQSHWWASCYHSWEQQWQSYKKYFFWQKFYDTTIPGSVSCHHSCCALTSCSEKKGFGITVKFSLLFTSYKSWARWWPIHWLFWPSALRWPSTFTWLTQQLTLWVICQLLLLAIRQHQTASLHLNLLHVGPWEEKSTPRLSSILQSEHIQSLSLLRPKTWLDPA